MEGINCGNPEFEKIAVDLIPKLMPKSFLEGFNECNSKTNKSINKSNVFFTSISHYHDDIFCCSIMNKINCGASLVVGQHGGGAFYSYCGATEVDLEIADKYLFPGNGIKGNNIKDVGQIFNHQKYNTYDKSGSALLVTYTIPRYSFDLRSMVISGQMTEYFEDQFAFYEALTDDIKNNICVRLHPLDDGWEHKLRWNDRFNNIKFDANRKMDSSINKSRLIIGTYAATTYNKTLASNIPTIIYWDDYYWELSEESKIFFDELESVGIFHRTPQSAAEHVIKIWDHIDDWWYDKKLQDVRVRYCRAFAYRTKNLAYNVSKVLKGEANKT